MNKVNLSDAGSLVGLYYKSLKDAGIPATTALEIAVDAARAIHRGDIYVDTTQRAS
jgi:hypothetical protein